MAAASPSSSGSAGSPATPKEAVAALAKTFAAAMKEAAPAPASPLVPLPTALPTKQTVVDGILNVPPMLDSHEKLVNYHFLLGKCICVLDFKKVRSSPPPFGMGIEI